MTFTKKEMMQITILSIVCWSLIGCLGRSDSEYKAESKKLIDLVDKNIGMNSTKEFRQVHQDNIMYFKDKFGLCYAAIGFHTHSPAGGVTFTNIPCIINDVSTTE